MSKLFSMPFGKYKNEYLQDIPSGYIRWLAENCDDDHIATMADEEYSRRTDEGEHFWD